MLHFGISYCQVQNSNICIRWLTDCLHQNIKSQASNVDFWTSLQASWIKVCLRNQYIQPALWMSLQPSKIWVSGLQSPPWARQTFYHLAPDLFNLIFTSPFTPCLTVCSLCLECPLPFYYQTSLGHSPKFTSSVIFFMMPLIIPSPQFLRTFYNTFMTTISSYIIVTEYWFSY